MTNFKLDSNANHELDDTSGTVYIAMPNNVSVEIYFETDDRQNINLLSVGDCYQEINGISEDYDYVMQFDYEYMAIKEIVEQFLYDNPIDDSEYQPYDTAASLGFSNSDFLYG